MDAAVFLFCRNAHTLDCFRRQESVDLLLGLNRPVVDEDGNIVGEFIQEPLDLDLWATRPAQLQQLRQGQQQGDGAGGASAAEATATGKRGGGTGGRTVGAASGFALLFPGRSLSGEGPVQATTAATGAAEEEAGGDDTHCCDRRIREITRRLEGRRRLQVSTYDRGWATRRTGSNSLPHRPST